MKREIKFRAWDNATSRMLVYEMHMSFYPFAIQPNGAVYKEGVLQDYVLMQYTGLKDRNGVEIYEGDILRLMYPRLHFCGGYEGKEELIVQIDFHGGGFWFTGGGATDCNWHFYNDEDREVIGNVFEHPHLLAKEAV